VVRFSPHLVIICVLMRQSEKSITSLLSVVKKRSQGAKRAFSLEQGLPLLYGHETWWMESSLDAKNSEGQFKVTRGHQRLNGLPLLYEHETWWAESSLDANNSESQVKVTRGHTRSNGLTNVVWT